MFKSVILLMSLNTVKYKDFPSRTFWTSYASKNALNTFIQQPFNSISQYVTVSVTVTY